MTQQQAAVIASSSQAGTAAETDETQDTLTLDQAVAQSALVQVCYAPSHLSCSDTNEDHSWGNVAHNLFLTRQDNHAGMQHGLQRVV